MAAVYILESNVLAYSGQGNVVFMPPDASEKVTFSTSTDSADFANSTKFVQIISDANAHFLVQPAAGAVAATTSDTFLPANQWFAFGVEPGKKLTIIAA